SNLIYAYYVRNNRVGLLPTFEGLQSGVGALRFMYFIRPSALVPSSNVCVITSIDLVSGTITFSKVPTTYSTMTPVDFYQFNSPHSILGIDVLPTSVSTTTNTMTFNVGNTVTTLSPGLAINAFPGGYFLISSTNNMNQYFVWFNNVWNGTSFVSAPIPSGADTIGRTGIEVDL